VPASRSVRAVRLTVLRIARMTSCQKKGRHTLNIEAGSNYSLSAGRTIYEVLSLVLRSSTRGRVALFEPYFVLRRLVCRSHILSKND
jgi:hypothetical protein